MRALGLLTVLAIALPAVASAQSPCDTARTTVEQSQCAGQAWQRADQDLNLAYQIARDRARQMDSYFSGSEPSTVIALRDAQRTWITFRDQACLVESYLARGGSLQQILYYTCLDRLTRQRTEDLRYFGEVN